MVAGVETLRSACLCQTLISLLDSHKSLVSQFLEFLAEMGHLVRVVFRRSHSVGLPDLFDSRSPSNPQDGVRIVQVLRVLTLSC